MKYLIALLAFSFLSNNNMQEIFSSSTKTKIKEWRVVNDGVMGGISESTVQLSNEGNLLFTGHVSLDNYGGFASIQLNTDVKIPTEKKFIVLKVKGDGKAYEFRLKASLSQYESYVHAFTTNGDWQVIKLPINEFYPQFRGQILNMPNFNFKKIAQISFLIANKKEEDFELLIDWISLE